MTIAETAWRKPKPPEPKYPPWTWSTPKPVWWPPVELRKCPHAECTFMLLPAQKCPEHDKAWHQYFFYSTGRPDF